MDAGTLSDLALRRMFCDFLCVSLLAVLARSEDNIETQVQAPYSQSLYGILICDIDSFNSTLTCEVMQRLSANSFRTSLTVWTLMMPKKIS
jgi:hypothetical protein